jgi:hypothetical protein
MVTDQFHDYKFSPSTLASSLPIQVSHFNSSLALSLPTFHEEQQHMNVVVSYPPLLATQSTSQSFSSLFTQLASKPRASIPSIFTLFFQTQIPNKCPAERGANACAL